ncbi:MarR family winged helix-turn-helix transcriptional regulator [Actinoplanes subtropicus]|uniref:MarR family winged helix-turn-helix transcriptional regulator n=1 Tax=Actinoplanes subtropicus TaxID=543632 RepID=UPI0004C40E26|nr:MarR family transcriptional regulator [Actinoplanes subtropicus]
MSKTEDGEMGIVAALVRSAFLVDTVYSASARKYGLTAQQGQLLCVLMARPYGMSELGPMLRLARSSLTGLVDRTERNGFVRRVPDPADQRLVRVALTAHGSRVVEEFYAETCRRVEELPASLTAGERDTLAALLGRVVRDHEVPAVFLAAEDETV